MLAIAISVLLLALTILAGWTIITSISQAWAISRGIVAELAELQEDHAVAGPVFRPLRGRPLISQQGHSRQPVRLRPLRRSCAAA